MVTENIINNYLASGTAAFKEGQFQAAGKMFFAAYQKSKTFKKSDPRLAVVYANLSLFYYQQKRYKKSENLLEQALKILIDDNQFSSPLCDNIRLQLANVYLAQKKYPALMSFYKDCLRQFHATGNWHAMSQLYDRIIDLYTALGKLRLAEVWCKRAIRDDKKSEMRDEAVAKKRMIRLAWLYTQQGRTDEAFSLYKSTIDQANNSASNSSFPSSAIRSTVLST